MLCLCPICDESFNARNEAKGHFDIKHEVDEESEMYASWADCQDCDFVTAYETNDIHYYSTVKRKAKKSKSGHISHNSDHNVRVV